MLRAELSKWILVINGDETAAQVVAADSGDGRRHLPAHPDRRPVGGAVRRACRRHRAGSLVAGSQSHTPPRRDCRAGRARRLHRHDGPPGRGRRARSALADRRGHRDRHPAAERRVRRAAGDAPRRHPVDGVAGPGGRRCIRTGRDRPRTRRRRPRRVGGAVPAGRIGDGVDARGGDAGLSRRQDRTRSAAATPNRHRSLVSEHRHAHRAGGGRRHRRPVDPAARRGPAGAAGADGARSRSPACPSVCRCRWCWCRSATR